MRVILERFRLVVATPHCVVVSPRNLPEALKWFRDGLAIAERLAQSDPGNAGWRRDLLVSHDRIGGVLGLQEILSEAMKSYRDGLAIAERLAQSDSGNADWLVDLAVSYVNLADIDPSQARALLTKASGIVRQMQLTGQLAPRDSWMPADFAQRIDALPKVSAPTPTPSRQPTRPTSGTFP
jgi:hypothetical protein